MFNGNGGHVFALIAFLIFAGMVLRNWNGANTLLGTGFKGGTGVITALQDNPAPAPAKK